MEDSEEGRALFAALVESLRTWDALLVAPESERPRAYDRVSREMRNLREKFAKVYDADHYLS